MKASEVMTRNPACCTVETTARRAAELMSENDCGCVPVVHGGQVVGVVTDRDLAVRGLARGRGPETPVSDLMTPDPVCCRPEASLEEVEETMASRQVRRVPVVDRTGDCVGIVAQADIALAPLTSSREVGHLLVEISVPSV